MEKLVTFKFDKERHLRLTLKGMLEFERITGRNLLKGFKIGDLTLNDTAALLWASLIHEDKELTLDDVLDMVDFSMFMPVMAALKESMLGSLPEAKAGERPLARKSRPG